MRLSINSPPFKISSSYEIPESIRQILDKVGQNHYEELYEVQSDGNITLEETLSELLDLLGNKDNSLCHYRYVCMAIILALAVKPTLKAYLSENKIMEKVFDLVINWFETKEIPVKEQINELFPQPSLGNQAIDEALDVFKNLLLILDPSKAKEVLLEILDDCLEGYAIFPGTQERRNLFDWWLLEVFPVAWFLQFPESIYTIKGVISFYSNSPPKRLLNIFDNHKNKDRIYAL